MLPLAQLVIVGFGGYLVIQGKTSVGVLVAFQAYLWRVFDPILQIANSISGTQRGLAALDRVCEVLDKPAELPDVPAALPAPSVVEELSFEHLSFAYGRGGPVINDFSNDVWNEEVPDPLDYRPVLSTRSGPDPTAVEVAVA